MYDFPIKYYEDNLIFNKKTKDCWAMFQIVGFNYDFLSADKKIMRLNTIARFISNVGIEAKILIIPVAQDIPAHYTSLIEGLNRNDKLYEVAKHISLSKHFLLTGSMCVGVKWFDTLSALQQKQLNETAVKVYKDNQKVVVDQEVRLLDEMRTKFGVTVEENPDREAFRRATAHLYDDKATSQGADYQFLRKELYKQLGIAP